MWQSLPTANDTRTIKHKMSRMEHGIFGVEMLTINYTAGTSVINCDQDAASMSTRITAHRGPHPIYHPYTPHDPPSTRLYYSNQSRSRSLWRWNGSDNHGKYLLAHRLVYAFCNYFSRFALTPSNLAEMEHILIKIWRACAFFFFTSIINSFSATTKCAHFLATNWIEICYIFWKDFLYLGPPC